MGAKMTYLKTLDGANARSTLHAAFPECLLANPDGADHPNARHYDTVHGLPEYKLCNGRASPSIKEITGQPSLG
jgi:hypothetical protein